jgi:hypothetical protein
MPVPSCELENFQRYNPALGKGPRAYALIQHLCYSAATLGLLWYAGQLDYSGKWLAALLLGAGLILNGRILDGSERARYWEMVRLAVLLALAPLLPFSASLLLAGYAGASALFWWWLAFAGKEDRVGLVSD